MASTQDASRPEVSTDTIQRVNKLAGDVMAVPPEAVGFDQRLQAVLDDLVAYKEHYHANNEKTRYG